MVTVWPQCLMYLFKDKLYEFSEIVRIFIIILFFTIHQQSCFAETLEGFVLFQVPLKLPGTKALLQ